MDPIEQLRADEAQLRGDPLERAWSRMATGEALEQRQADREREQAHEAFLLKVAQSEVQRRVELATQGHTSAEAQQVYQQAEMLRQGRIAELTTELERLQRHGVARVPSAADVDSYSAQLARSAELSAWWSSDVMLRARRLERETRPPVRVPAELRRAAAREEHGSVVSRARPWQVEDYTRSQMGGEISRSQVSGFPADPAETCDPRVLARPVQQTGDW